MEAIKVMIVDDHEMVRLGIRTYLNFDPSFQVVKEAESGEEAIAFLRSSHTEDWPHVCLMDVKMTGMGGIEATKVVATEFPDIKVIMLTSFLNDTYVVEAIEAGAVSYVLKTVSADELAQAIKGAFHQKVMMHAEIASALTRGIRQRLNSEDHNGITGREMEVLQLIAQGANNKDIAEALHISIKTVKTHVSNLLLKCQLQDRTQLAVYAHRKGWTKN